MPAHSLGILGRLVWLSRVWVKAFIVCFFFCFFVSSGFISACDLSRSWQTQRSRTKYAPKGATTSGNNHLHTPNFPAAVPVRAPGPKSLRTRAGLGGSSQHPHKEKQKERKRTRNPSHRGSHRGSPKDHKGKKTRPQKKNLGPVAAVMEGGFEVLEEGCPSREGKGKGESRLFVRS